MVLKDKQVVVTANIETILYQEEKDTFVVNFANSWLKLTPLDYEKVVKAMDTDSYFEAEAGLIVKDKIAYTEADGDGLCKVTAAGGTWLILTENEWAQLKKLVH